uniref:Uncharacterized protein n=1 Tax=Romanomermis culicivorax TaxID=13658 RepID=A0A915JWJ3_ROMCU
MGSPKSKSTFQLNVSAEIVKDDERKAPPKNVTTDQQPTVDDDVSRPNLVTVLNILTVLLEKSNKNAVHENDICKSAKIVCPNWKVTDEDMEKHIRAFEAGPTEQAPGAGCNQYDNGDTQKNRDYFELGNRDYPIYCNRALFQSTGQIKDS